MHVVCCATRDDWVICEMTRCRGVHEAVGTEIHSRAGDEHPHDIACS